MVGKQTHHKTKIFYQRTPKYPLHKERECKAKCGLDYNISHEGVLMKHLELKIHANPRNNIKKL